MRIAFATFAAAAGIGLAAQAQAPQTPAPTNVSPPNAAPVTPAAPPAAPAAPAAQVPATPPPAGSTASAPGSAPAAADAAGTPTLPTTGEGAAVLSVVQRVCEPMVKGGDFDQLAKSAGMKKARGGAYTLGLGGDRAYNITLNPPGSNRNVCQADIRYAVGGEQPIVTALNIYAFLHQPELQLQRNDFLVGADNVKRITLSWEHYTDKESTGVVFVQLKNANGAPLNGKYDQATLLYSERKF